MDGIGTFLESKEFLLVLSGFVFTGLIGAGLSASIQHRSWKLQQRALRKHAEVESASKLFEELSALMDKRLYRMRQVIYGIRKIPTNREIAQARMDEYRNVLFEWNDKINRNLAMTRRYFGNDMRNRLEREIFFLFRKLGSEIEAEFKKTPFDTIAAFNIHERLNDLNAKVYSFDDAMLKIIEQNLQGDVRLKTDARSKSRVGLNLRSRFSRWVERANLASSRKA